MAALIRCLCGHTYDPGAHTACPECGRQRKSAASGKAGALRQPVPPPPPAPPPAAASSGSAGWLWKLGGAAAGLILIVVMVTVMRDESGQGAGGEERGAVDQQRQAAAGAGGACERAVGRWRWFTGGFVTIGPDGRAFFQPTEDAPPALHAQWQCDDSDGTYTLSWSHGFVETVRVYQEGNVISGTNNVGVEVSGTRYVDSTQGMPQLQFEQSGSRPMPSSLPRLLAAAGTVARNWRPDAYAVGLRVRKDGFPNQDSHYVEVQFYSPSEGTGLWVSSHRTRNQMREAGTVNWGTDAIPEDFIDFPDAVAVARQNGMRGLVDRAELDVDRRWSPPQPVWRIWAELHGAQPPLIHAVSGQVMQL